MLLVLLQLHTANATDHCVDKKRGLIMDSCEDLSKFRRQQLAPRSTAETPSIVKRENALNFEPKYTLESLPRDGELLFFREWAQHQALTNMQQILRSVQTLL